MYFLECNYFSEAYVEFLHKGALRFPVWNSNYITCVLSNAHNTRLKIGKIILFSKETGCFVSYWMHKIPWIIVIDIVIAINTRNYRDIFLSPYRPSLLLCLVSLHVVSFLFALRCIFHYVRTWCVAWEQHGLSDIATVTTEGGYLWRVNWGLLWPADCTLSLTYSIPQHKSSKCVISPLIFPWSGHRQRVRRGADQTLVCESLHERPIILQLVEAAAEGAEADAGLFLRWMCQRGHRVLLSDSGHTAQRWRGLHPRRPACARLTDSRHRLLLVRVTYKRTRTPLCGSDNIVAEEILWFRTVLSPRALQETSHVTAHQVAGSWMYSISDRDHY